MLEKFLYESVEAMKKIFAMLVVLFALICATPALAYSQKTEMCTGEMITGSACSISELNNLEKNKNADEKLGLNPKGAKDLRPVRFTSEIRKSNSDDCIFGMCLIKTLLGR